MKSDVVLFTSYSLKLPEILKTLGLMYFEHDSQSSYSIVVLHAGVLQSIKAMSITFP